MTKSLKGLSSRNFTTSNDLDQAFTGRQAISALSASSLSPAEASLANSDSIAVDLIAIDENASGGEFVVLDCLDPKEMRLQFLSQRGEDPLAILRLASSPPRASRSATRARSACRSAVPSPA